MKLHLPIGLRKALLAVFAVVTPATVAVTVASASASAEGVATISDLPDSVIAVVGDKVSTYNDDVAQKAYDDAYDAAENTTAYTEAYNAAFSSTREEVSKQYAADAQTKAQNSAEYTTVGSNAYTKAWNEKESERLDAQQLAEEAKRAEIYAAAYAEALKEDISLSNLGSYYARYEELYEQYKKDGLKWYQASAKALETVGNEIAADKADAAVATKESQDKITAFGLSAYNDYGKSDAENARDKAQKNYLDGIYKTEYDRALEAEGKTAGEAAGLAAGAGVQDAAGKEAVNNAAYVYSTTYGSEKVTYEDKNGNTVTVDLHTNKADFTEFGLDNKSSEKTDIAKMELQNGNLVLDKASYYDVAIGEETTNDVAHGEDHTHNVVNNAEVQYRIHDYELDKEIDLEEGSVITTKPANSITIGTEDAAGGIKASTVDMDALAGITVQNGSYITATDGAVDLYSESGTITVTGEGSTLQGEEVNLDGDKIVLSDGASVSTTGAATALPDGDLATYVENATYDVTLNADTSIAITGAAEVTLPNGETTYLPTSVSGKDVLLSSKGGIEVSDGAKVAGSNSVKVDAASFTASNKADVNAIKVDISTTGDITVSESTIGTDTKSVVSLVSKDGDVNIIGDIINSGHRTSNTQIAGKHIDIAGKNVIWDGGRIRTSAAGSEFSMTAEEKLLIMDGADMYAQGTVSFQGGEIIMSGAYLNLQHAVTDLVATSGNIVLNGNPTDEEFASYGITPHDNWYKYTAIISNKAITLSAENGDIILKTANIQCGNDVVTLTAGGAISLTDGAYITGRAVSLSGDTLLLSGEKVYLTAKGFDERNIPGNLTLTFENGITIKDGATVNADRNISMSTTNGNISITSTDLVTEKGFVNLSAGNNITLAGVTTGKTGVSMTATGGSITTDKAITAEEGTVVLNAGQNLALTGAAVTGKNGVSMSATGGSITANQAITAEEGTVVLNAGQNLALTGAAVTGKNGVSMTATKGSITTDKDIAAEEGTVVLNAGQNLALTGAAVTGKNGVSMTASNGSITTDKAITAAEGAVVLNAGQNLALTGAAVTGKNGVSMTASNGSITTDKAITAEEGAVVLNASDDINLTGDAITGKTGVSMTAADGSITTNGNITASEGSVTLISGTDSGVLDVAKTDGITLSGNTITAGKDVILSTGHLLANNTISDSTVTANGAFSLIGNEVVYTTFGKVIFEHGTSGINSITDSTISAGSTVNIGGVWNTIKGTVTEGVSTTNMTGSGVAVGLAGGTLYNDINGAFVTATTGNIVLNAIANNVGADSVLTSEQGSIALKGATVEGLDKLLEYLGYLPIDLPIDKIDLSANMVAGTLNAGQNVSVDATANILSGGAVNGNTGVALSGALNVLTGSNVASSTGGVDLLANEGVGGTLIDTLLDLAKDNGIDLGDLSQWTDALKGLTTEQGINVLTGGSVSGNTYVNMDGIANVMTNGTVGSNGAVTLDGAINAVTGGGIKGGSVTLQASEDKSLDIGGIISAVLGATQGGETTTPDGGDGTETTDSTLSGLLTQLGTINGNGNLVLGENTVVEATTGDVTLDGTLNVLGGGKVDAYQNVLLNGEINVLAGTNVIADNGDINLTASSENSALADALVGLLDEDMQEQLKPLLDGLDGGVNVLAGGSVDAVAGNVNLQGMANVLTAGTVTAGEAVTIDGAINAITGGSIEGGSIAFKNSGTGIALGDIVSSLIGGNTEGEGSTDGEETDNTISDIIDSLGDLNLNGSANLVIGGETTTLTATTGDVTMDGALNLVTGGTVSATTGSTLMTGTANVLTGGAVNAGQDVAMSGTINAVVNGKVEGGSVELKANEGSALNLGGIISGLLGSEDTEGTEGEENIFSDLIENLGDSLNGNANLVAGGTVNATTGNVTMDGTINLLTGGTVSAAQGTVAMSGTANVLTGGTVNNSQAVTLSGAVNAVTGGTVEGGSVELKASENGLNVGEILGTLLESAQIEGLEDVTDVLSGLDLNGNANLVAGGTVNATTGNVTMDGIINLQTGGKVSSAAGDVLAKGSINLVTGGELAAKNALTLDGPANIVTGGTLAGNDVELKGEDMELGSLVGGLLDGVLDGVEIPEELNGLLSGDVTDVLNNLTGNFNVVTGDKAVIAADSTASLTGTVNYVGDGASVTGNNVTVNGAANVLLNGATLEADNKLTLTGTGAGLSLGSFITIPEEYKEYADQLGLTALLNKEASANVVMGDETGLVGKTVELSAMVNMLSDRADVVGDSIALNGNMNIVTDGVTLDAADDITLNGDLNLVTHVVLDDLMNAIQNGTALPADNGEYTTLLESDGSIKLVGAANAVHGDVVVDAKGDVLMEGSGQPLFQTENLNLQQIVDLASKLGAGELLGTAKDEALALIKDYINTNDLSGLVDIAKELGVEDLLNGSLEDGKQSVLDFIAQNAGAKLPELDLTGNVNVVSTGAYVHGANVTMNGTANLVTDGAKIEADGAVSMNGMANIVAGGATVSGTDVNLSGGMNVIVDTTLDNVKDAITNGSLDSIATGGTTQTTIAAKDELVLDATANLVNGYVSLSSDNSVTMEGITNVVAGEAEVQGANSVEMDGVLNVVAGGATVGSSAGDITMGGGMNMIVDTSLENVVDALQQQSLAPLMQGGSVDTTLTAASDITLNATVNAVNGGQVTLDAGDTMKMSGAVNVVSGNATLKGEDIVMAGDKSLAVDLNTLLPAEWSDKAAELGLSDMLEGGLSLNAVAGGANLIAEDDITMSGIASVVVDTSMGNIMEALATQSIDPLIKGGTSETNLEANNINMLSKLNVVSGGKVRLDADNNVKMDGVANMVHGNTVVEAGNTISVSGAANVVAGGATLDAKNIKMTGKGSISADLEGLLPADWAEKAAELGLTDVLEKGVNVNAVAGGANLLAEEDITMGGMATFVVDTTVENVMDAMKQMSIDPLLQGGTTETVLSAEREIHMNSLVNVVSGGKVTVEAGRNVNMSGVANVVNGNAVVDAGETIYMFGAANVVSGGADLTADYIEMTGNGSINGKIADVLESVLPGVALPTNGSVNAILGEGTTLDADKVALSGALNVVDGATVSGDDSVLMNGNVNMLSNNAEVVSANGNISINGGAGVQSVTTMENASLTAEKGKVVFNNALVDSTGSTVTAGLGMTVTGNSSVLLNDVLLGGETLVSADSDLTIDSMLQTNDGTFIENMGSLSLNDVALSAGTELFNGGVIQIDGDLSLDSVKLTYVIETLTNNDTAITLGANANITAADITNVTFVIESDKVASALYNYEEFAFVLFENASAEDFSLVEAALAQNEITFTINGATWSNFNDELEVRHEGGNIVIMGNVVIPEPTTATLSLLALAALAARRRRK